MKFTPKVKSFGSLCPNLFWYILYVKHLKCRKIYISKNIHLFVITNIFKLSKYISFIKGIVLSDRLVYFFFLLNNYNLFICCRVTNFVGFLIKETKRGSVIPGKFSFGVLIFEFGSLIPGSIWKTKSVKRHIKLFLYDDLGHVVKMKTKVSLGS